jgi:hypothetical protein
MRESQRITRVAKLRTAHRRTPAQATGIDSCPWEMSGMVAMIEEWERRVPDTSGYFTYAEWEQWATNKLTDIAFGDLQRVNTLTGHSRPIDRKDREEYLRVQIEAVIQQALRHGRSGRGNNDPVCP